MDRTRPTLSQKSTTFRSENWLPRSVLNRIRFNSDRGVQYLAIVYSTRLEEAGVAPSVGSKGDSFEAPR